MGFAMECFPSSNMSFLYSRAFFDTRSLNFCGNFVVMFLDIRLIHVALTYVEILL